MEEAWLEGGVCVRACVRTCVRASVYMGCVCACTCVHVTCDFMTIYFMLTISSTFLSWRAILVITVCIFGIKRSMTIIEKSNAFAFFPEMCRSFRIVTS